MLFLLSSPAFPAPFCLTLSYPVLSYPISLFSSYVLQGLNEEWASVQSELIAAESDRAVLKTELLTAAQNKVKTDESYDKQVRFIQY